MENLSEKLPISWQSLKLGQLVENEKGKKPKNQSSEKSTEFDLPYIDIEAFEEGNIKSWTDGKGCRLCYESDFLMVWDGSRSGLVGKGMNGALGSTLVRINFPGMNNQYAYYFLLSKYQEINTRAKGSGTPHVDPGLLWNYEFPIAPLNEQKCIVAKIEELFSELDNGIAALKAAREQLKVYRQAVLKHAFEGKLTAQWRKDNADKLESPEQLLAHIQTERETRYQQQLDEWKQALKHWETNGQQGKKPTRPKEPVQASLAKLSDEHYLSDIPNNWGCLKAEHLCDFITKGTTPAKTELFANSGDVPFIKVYNLTKDGTLDFSIEPTFVSKETHQGFLARSKVYPKDVLMNIVGPPLGKVSIVPDTFAEWNINQAIAIFRSHILLPKFLAEFLLFEKTVNFMMSQSKATAGQFNLTLEICRELPIPVPSQTEQIELVQRLEEKLSNLDAVAAGIDEQLAKAETLRQSILKKAFSGQLVPQDPNDEPASELLARIQTEKTPAQRAKKSAQPTKEQPA